MRKLLAAAWAGLALLFGTPAFAEPIQVYNTYLTPPFVTGDEGLAADTTAYLNKKLAGKYELKLVNIQRARLNYSTLDKEGFNGAILFTNPMFVGDESKSRFSWSEPVFSDGNVVVSPAAKKFDFQGPESFDGKVFVGVAGNRYAGLEERFGKGIQRIDSTHEGLVLKKLAEGGGDVAVMARSIGTYLASQPDLKGKIFIDPKPYSSFTRHILVTKANPGLATALNQVVAQMKSDAEWKAILAKYGL